LFHWWYCNKLVHFTRKSSDLHEAQLNFKLLKPLKINTIPDLKNLPSYYGFKRIKSLPENLASLTDNSKFNIIFHPKSKGSAREWPLEKYYELAKILGDHYKIFVTGTENEGQKIRDEKPDFFLLPNIIDLTGKLNLDELVSFIAKCDGLLACSTGPLHISAALGKHTCGIYPPMKPIHPGRWAPLGKKANVAVLPINCKACRKTEKCLCIESIGTLQISELIKTWRQEKK
jgi:ADP-heptose:LPS heptosyltransferase